MSGDRLVKRSESHADEAARPLSNLRGSIRKASQQTLRWILETRIDCRFGVQVQDLVVVGSSPTSLPFNMEAVAQFGRARQTLANTSLIRFELLETHSTAGAEYMA